MAWMLSPCLEAQVRRGLDDAEVDAVAEHFAAAKQQDPGILGGCMAQGRVQPPALFGGHRAVVELEGQHPDRPVAVVADLPVSGVVAGVRNLGEPAVQGSGGGQLHAPVCSVDAGTELADPDRAVTGADQHRAVPAGHDGTRPGIAN